MLTIKSQFEQPQESPDVGIRRLLNALESHVESASKAHQRIEQAVAQDRYFGLANIMEDSDLIELLRVTFGNDWEHMVTGNIV